LINFNKFVPSKKRVQCQIDRSVVAAAVAVGAVVGLIYQSDKVNPQAETAGAEEEEMREGGLEGEAELGHISIGNLTLLPLTFWVAEPIGLCF
jgi:hypothetical protein